nr:microtubule-associated protein 4 isoform X1 [Chelonoidis abingdonii]XP_032642478.1 microtubule-associated protein 4 isoform X2 [Chelonoidis abingdonii]XP_032642479.1 microtubule-associated protein 4 isoform X2 [Chelonoidis abingdonii]XP_032642480.1 microtubule-associated protein 4 isoform X2 [Chelonoidis abingdonii]XP_032642481.1 microtubule-associated protein 4 isoform X2 [Chelonoidis abingdonii]
MADFDHNLSLADALTEPPAEIEEEVKRDFIATLEAEKFDDVVGETVGKTDYIPLLDDDDDDDAKAGSQEPKSKPHTDGGQVESTSAVGPAVLENGDHGTEDDSTVFPREIMGEKMSYKEFLDRNETWAMDDRDLCFEPQSIFRPMEGTEPFRMHREDVLCDLLLRPSEMETRLPFTEHFEASEEVHAPHAAMMVPELPSLGSPYSHAEVTDPSAFITLDSTTESLLNIEAPARVTVPEENWPGAEHAVEKLDESSFVEPPEPTRIADAAEEYLPGSPVAAVPAAVPSALTEPTEETKATDAPQVEPTESVPVMGDASVPVMGDASVPVVEELMVFEPSVEQHKSAVNEPPTVSSAPAVVMEQKMTVTEASTLGADSTPMLENVEENKPSPSKHIEHLLKPNEELLELAVPVEAKEPLTLIETKETLPEKTAPAADLAIVEELKEEAELSHAHHTEPPQKKSPLEPTGVPTAQVRQANKSSDRRFGRAKPAAVPGADVPEELLVGLPQQKSTDPKADPFSMAELGWVSGTFSRTRTPHKKAAGQLLSMPSEFVESQRDVPRESWDSEGSPVIVKKKKKKQKQKRNQQPRTMELGDENVEVSKAPKVPLFAAELQKADVPFVLPAEGVKEHSAHSREGQRKGTSNVPRDAKAGTESHLVGDQNFISSPTAGQQSLKTEGPFKFLLDAKAGEVMKQEEMKADSLFQSESKNKQVPLEKLECKTEHTKMGDPSSALTQTKPIEISFVDKNKKIECKHSEHSDLKVSLSKGINLNKVETPLETKPVEISLIDENKEIKCTSPKHVAADETVPSEVQTPSGTLMGEKPKKRGSDEKSRKTENGFSKEPAVLEIKTDTTNLPAAAKRVNKTKETDSFDKSQETGSITSEPPLETATDITKVPLIPLVSDKPKEGIAGQNKKADFSFSEQPFLLETKTDTAKLRAPAETVDITNIGFTDKSKQTGFDHPAVTDPNMALVTDKPKKRGSDGKNKKVKNSSEQPVFMEAETDPDKLPAVAKTAGKTKEIIFTDEDTEPSFAVAEHSLEDMTGPSTAKVAEKPKKRTSDGKNKKAEKGYFQQPFFLEAKEDTSSLPTVMQKDDKTEKVSFTDKGKETDFTTADHLLEGATATMKVQGPTATLVTEEPKNGITGKSEKAEFSISEQPDAAKLPASAETISKTKEDSLMDKSKETGFTTDSSRALLSDKPKEKGSDRKGKKVGKSSFEQPFLLEAKTDTSKLPTVVEKAEKMKEMGFADVGKEPIFTTTGHQLENLTDTTKVQVPTMKLITEKPKIKESNEKSFFEQLVPSDYKMDTAQSETLIKTKETPFSDKGKETDFTTLEHLLEDIRDIAKAHIPMTELAADKTKRCSDGKSKKIENSAEHLAVLEAKTDSIKLPAVVKEANKIKETHSTDKGQETQFTISEHLLEDITDTAKIQTPITPLVTGKPKETNKENSTKADVRSEKPFLLETKVDAATLPGGADKTEAVSSTDESQVAGFTILEHQMMTDPSPALVTNKSKKRGNDGKNREAKNASEQPVLLETKIDKSKIQPPIVTDLEYQMEEMGLVDENQNIKNFPSEHQMLWDNKGHLFTPFTQSGAVGVDRVDKASIFPEYPVKDEGWKVPVPPAVVWEGTNKESSTGDKREKNKHSHYEHSVTLEGEDAGVQAFASVKEGDEIKVTSAGDKKKKGKRPSLDSPVKQDAKAGRDEVHTSILAEIDDKGISFTGEKQSTECASLEHLVKETDAMKGTIPTDAKVTDKMEGSSSAGEKDVGCISPELTVQWENKAEAVVLQVLGTTEVVNEAKEAELGEQSFSECPVSLEKKTDAAEVASVTLRDAQTEEISPTDKIKGHSEHSEGDAADKMKAGLKDFQALKSEEDKYADLPQKQIDGSGQKVVKETKKEARVKATEQIKGYMRPTKSRGLPTPPPRPAVQDREKPRQLKANGMSRQRQEKAKPEEIKLVEVVTGSDITAPPNKELPPSPEKKSKPSVSTPSAKPAATKTKPLSSTSPKRPASATPGQNKKPTSPTAGPTSATTPKRSATSTTRPSTLTPKDTKPKVTDAKSPDKRTSLSKPLSATTPRAAVKVSPATPRTTAASPVTTPSGPRNTATSPPKRPTSIKTETKPADARKTTAKSPSADLSRPKSAPANSAKSSATTPTAATPGTLASPGVATSRPKPKPAAARPTTASSATPEAKKPSTVKAPLKTSTVPKPPRPTSSVSAPDLKNIRSKIGSTDNIKHQPGGGRAKVEKKPESAGAARKSESNAVSKMATTKTTVTKEGAQKQPNGKVQIVSKKANYSHVQSKCGSKDNIKHVPGGGNVPNAPKPASGSRSQPSIAPKPSPGSTNVQIQSKKVDISKVSSKCGSKTNIKHKPGGGDVKIENQKLNFKEKAQAKVGSLDNVGHVPAGGTVKPEGSEEAALLAQAPQNGDVTAPQADSEMRENGVGPTAPTVGGGDQREILSFGCQIQETSI